MKRPVALVGWGVESAILAGLFWRYTGVYTLGVVGPFPLFYASVLYVVVVFAQWRVLPKQHLGRNVWLRLCFLTGPCVCLSMFLVLALSLGLEAVAMAGGATKEMGEAASQQGVLPGCFQQWSKDTVQRIRSERLIYAMLLASTCLLYGSRYSKAGEVSGSLC